MSVKPADLVQAIILAIHVVQQAQAQINEAKDCIISAADKLWPQDPDGIVKAIKRYAGTDLAPEEIWERIKAEQRGSVIAAKVDELRTRSEVAEDRAATAMGAFGRTIRAAKNSAAR